MSASPASTSLRIVVNGDDCELHDGASVADLLARLELAGRRVAVAINRDVVPRSTHATHRLAPGDRVEILEAVGGG